MNVLLVNIDLGVSKENVEVEMEMVYDFSSMKNVSNIKIKGMINEQNRVVVKTVVFY